LGPNILLSTLFSKTLSLHSSLNVSDQVSQPYKMQYNTMQCNKVQYHNKIHQYNNNSTWHFVYWVTSKSSLTKIMNPR
jgi:hypothetical protein